MANKRPHDQSINRQCIRLSILLILFFGLHHSPVQSEGFFSSFSKRKLLIKPTSIVKGFFKNFKPFQEFPNFNEGNQITHDDLLMQQAFNSPARLPLESTNGIPPISEYLVSNFARLNPANLKQAFSGNQASQFQKDQMSLSESITSSNVFYPNMMPSASSPINHNLMFDQSQRVPQQASSFVDADGDYPAQQSQISNNYRSNEKPTSGPSLSIGAAAGGGIGLKLGKFQMTFKRGNDGPQINLGTHEEEADDQNAENSNNYISMARSKDKKQRMNIKLGKAVQFSIGGNQDGEDKMKTGDSSRNVISLDTNRLKERLLPRKSGGSLMSSASENSYDESPGIQMPAITIGGSGNGRPAITIGGGGENEEEGPSGYGARPAITIGGGDPGEQEGTNYNNAASGSQGSDHWGDHWNDHKRPRIRMKMPDFPQTYIEKNLKMPPIKLKLNSSPRVKITTGKFWMIRFAY